MVLRLDVATPHRGGCKHAEGSHGFEHAEGFSQVHDELTLLNLSHIQRVLCTWFHDALNTRIIASVMTKPNQLGLEDVFGNSRTQERTEAHSDVF